MKQTGQADLGSGILRQTSRQAISLRVSLFWDAVRHTCTCTYVPTQRSPSGVNPSGQSQV